MKYKTVSNLKHIRNSQDVSINQLYKQTGISHDFLTNLDNNGLIPAFDKIERIADALNVPIDKLIQFAPVNDSVSLKFLGFVYHTNDDKDKAKITALTELDKDKQRFAGIIIFDVTKNDIHNYTINATLPQNSNIVQDIDNTTMLSKIGQTTYFDQSDFFSAFYSLSAADHKTLVPDIAQSLNGFLIARGFVKTFTDFDAKQGINYSYWFSWCKLWNFIFESNNEKYKIKDLISETKEPLVYTFKNVPLKLTKQAQIENNDLYFE